MLCVRMCGVSLWKFRVVYHVHCQHAIIPHELSPFHPTFYRFFVVSVFRFIFRGCRTIGRTTSRVCGTVLNKVPRNSNNWSSELLVHSQFFFVPSHPVFEQSNGNKCLTTNQPDSNPLWSPPLLLQLPPPPLPTSTLCHDARLAMNPVTPVLSVREWIQTNLALANQMNMETIQMAGMQHPVIIGCAHPIRTSNYWLCSIPQLQFL